MQEGADVSQVIHTMSNLSEDILGKCFGTGDKEGGSTDKDTQSSLEVDRTPTGKTTMTTASMSATRSRSRWSSRDGPKRTSWDRGKSAHAQTG